MVKNNTNSKKGFTIIEVVLVLAIAGLIFLMVFIALPAMQASQRDTQRRNDLSMFASQLTQYSANNRGKVPSTADKGAEGAQKAWSKFVSDYLAKVEYKTENNELGAPIFEIEGNNFVDPDGEPYTVLYEGPVAKSETGDDAITLAYDFSGNQHTIHVYSYAECNGEEIVRSTGQRKVAFQYKLEGAGVYCGHN